MITRYETTADKRRRQALEADKNAAVDRASDSTMMSDDEARAKALANIREQAATTGLSNGPKPPAVVEPVRLRKARQAGIKQPMTFLASDKAQGQVTR